MKLWISILYICHHSILFGFNNDSTIFIRKSCDESINSNRIIERVIDLSISDSLSILRIGVIDNCSISDTGTYSIRNDSVFLSSTLVTSDNGDYNISTTCACYYDIEFYVPFKLNASSTYYYKNKKIEISKNKFISAEYKTRHGDNLVIWDDLGNLYSRKYFE